MKNISINKLKDFIGKEVQLNGWIYNLRSVGKIWFAIVRDGTGFVNALLQVMMFLLMFLNLNLVLLKNHL